MATPWLTFVILCCLSVLTNIGIATAAITITDLCPTNMLSNWNAKNLTQPWFYYIATSTDYDAEWPAWPDTPHEQAYQNISKYLSITQNFPETTNIRADYGLFTTSQLNNMISELNGDTINSYQPSTCDATCWTETKNTVKSEVYSVSGLSNFRDEMNDFMDSSNTNYQQQISAVTQLLQVEPTDQVISSGGSGSNAWSIVSSTANAFAGLMAIVDPELAPVAWVITSTSTIGGSVISGQNSGTYDITIDMNNALYVTSSQFSTDVQTNFNNGKLEIANDETVIADNSGKLSAFSTCNARLNAALVEVDKSLGTIVAESVIAAAPGMAVQSYEAMLPSKYIYWAEFQCTDADRSKCCSGTNWPSCSHGEAASWARSSVSKQITGGNLNGWIGASVSDDPSAAIGQDAVNNFNSNLFAITANSQYTFLYITNQINQMGTSAVSFPSPVTVPITDTISFSYNTRNLTSWCEYGCGYTGPHNCYCPSHGSCTFDCTCPSSKVVCKLCTGCTTECGQKCGSCLSSTTTVLMADNEWKSITDISVGDMVMNPLTNQEHEVQQITTPLRNRRKLYTINDASFSFTKAHPLLLYSDEHNVIGAIDINALSFYVPTYNQSNMRQVNLDQNLSVYSSNSVTSQRITSLTTNVFDIETDDDGEILYDLVFSFDSPSAYVVNDGIIVYNEWYDFSVFPKTTQIILGILVDLVNSNNTLYQLSTNRERNRHLVNNISFLIANHSLAFYDVINDHVDSVMLTDDLSSCNNYTLDISSKSNSIEALFSNKLWATRAAIEEFIARISPKLRYIFDSKQYEYYDRLCYDEIGSNQLMLKLSDSIYEAMSTLEQFLNRSNSTTDTTDHAIQFALNDTFWFILIILCFVGV